METKQRIDYLVDHPVMPLQQQTESTVIPFPDPVYQLQILIHETIIRQKKRQPFS